MLQKIQALIVLYHEELADNMSYRMITKKLVSVGFTVRHRLRDKWSKSGQLIAYRAKGFKMLFLNIKSLPLEVGLMVKEAKRKLRRLISLKQ